MPTYELVKHVRAAYPSAAWTTEVVTGHPPVPGVLPTLRRRVLGRTYRALEPTIWWPYDVCWSAVLDLHRRGEHDDAGALAKLLLWCDNHGHGYCWEIRERAELAS